MILIIEAYDALCSLSTFQINGISADYDDFGEKADLNRRAAPDHGCGNMTFTPYAEPREGILERYQINMENYQEICDKLTEALSFGYCGWCI